MKLLRSSTTPSRCSALRRAPAAGFGIGKRGTGGGDGKGTEGADALYDVRSKLDQRGGKIDPAPTAHPTVPQWDNFVEILGSTPERSRRLARLFIRLGFDAVQLQKEMHGQVRPRSRAKGAQKVRKGSLVPPFLADQDSFTHYNTNKSTKSPKLKSRKSQDNITS